MTEDEHGPLARMARRDPLEVLRSRLHRVEAGRLFLNKQHAVVM